MSLRRIQQDNVYVVKPFQVQGAATTASIGINEKIPDVKRVDETVFSRKPEWRVLLIKQDQDRHAEQKTYENDLTANGKSETVPMGEFADDPIAECRMPTESELRQARLMNIPTRGFCVGADIEKINADSYRYSYDPEEFAPPDI